MIRYSMSEILKTASEMPDKNSQVNWLRQQYRDAIGIVLRFALDPEIKFLLPDSDPPYQPCETNEAHGMLYTEARRLYLFVEGGNPNLPQLRRETIFVQLLEGVDKEDAKLLLAMKNKTLPYGITEDLIREAFPGLLPERVAPVATEPEPVQEKKTVTKKKAKEKA